jgi:hypothetical protein
MGQREMLAVARGDARPGIMEVKSDFMRDEWRSLGAIPNGETDAEHRQPRLAPALTSTHPVRVGPSG